ncbi:MAG: ABC transporter ATP-binding protein [Candidatus Aenigmarchaeota archaeon]|nr:ABC transporter ATP-binding protein [Candidatus Aenigmarchaeota archaeon]
MNMILIKDLSFEYSGDEKVLRNINLEIDKGFFSLVGVSGCGKSTLCLALNGLIPHEIGGKISGKVEVSGLDTQKHPIKELATHAGMVFQNPESQLFALSVEDEIAFGPSNLALPYSEVKKRVDKVLKQLDIEYLRNKSPEEMSSGEKQKVAVASALAMEPEILVLDEPTANLDPASTEEIFRLLKRLSRDMLVFVAEHDIAKVLRYSDMVAVMDKGTIVMQGTPREIISNPEIGKYLYLPKICRICEKINVNPIALTVSELVEKVRVRKKLKVKKQAKGKGEFIVEIKDLCFGYSKEKPVLDNVNLCVKKGEFLAIVGENGAGKSTLALHLNGLLKPVSGKIFIGGSDTEDSKVSFLSRTVGYVFQNPDLQMFEDSLIDEISFGPKNLGLDEKKINERVYEALGYTGLETFSDSDPFSLSAGQKRRVTIASILSMKPQVIVLDEPSTGLDIKTAESLMELVSKLNSSGHTIIMITHDMDLVADYAKRVVVMKKGRIIADDDTRAVFRNDRLMAESNLLRPDIAIFGKLIGEPNILTMDDCLAVIGKK